MAKIYKDKNVYDAAIERYQTVFREFDNYYVSVSGGKDSSIMLQLMAQEARRAGKRFSVLYIDLEAQYQATIAHINDLIDCTKDVVDKWYWVRLKLRQPLSFLFGGQFPDQVHPSLQQPGKLLVTAVQLPADILKLSHVHPPFFYHRSLSFL